MKIYLNLLTMYNLNIKNFINNVGDVKWKFVVFHLILTSLMLFVPVFFFIAKAGPYELYSRLYALSTEIQAPDTSSIQIDTDENGRIVSIYSPSEIITADLVNYAFFDEITLEQLDNLDKNKIWLCFSNEVSAYVDVNNRLAVSTDVLSKNQILEFDIKEMFNTMALYNNYWSSFMVPILGLLFLVIIVLQLLFLTFSTVLLGYERLIHHPISLGDRIKIMIMGSSLPALGSIVLGFIIPAVHIFVFEIVCIMVIIYILRRYDKYYVPKD